MLLLFILFPLIFTLVFAGCSEILVLVHHVQFLFLLSGLLTVVLCWVAISYFCVAIISSSCAATSFLKDTTNSFIEKVLQTSNFLEYYVHFVSSLTMFLVNVDQDIVEKNHPVECDGIFTFAMFPGDMCH